jgi:hypothetical protein
LSREKARTIRGSFIPKEYLGHNSNLTAITHVYAIQVTLDDPDDECETGEHVSKIYSQMTK